MASGWATLWSRPSTGRLGAPRRKDKGGSEGRLGSRDDQARHIAGFVRPSLDVAARKPRYYRHFSEPVLWRDVMCAKTSRKPRVPKHEATRTVDLNRFALNTRAFYPIHKWQVCTTLGRGGRGGSRTPNGLKSPQMPDHTALAYTS